MTFMNNESVFFRTSYVVPQMENVVPLWNNAPVLKPIEEQPPAGLIKNEKAVNVSVTVYSNAARVQIATAKQSFWFDDEVSAIAAIAERVLVHSAIMPGLRRLPKLVIQCEYKEAKREDIPIKFIRGTRVIQDPAEPSGRKFVRTPGASAKSWLDEPGVK